LLVNRADEYLYLAKEGGRNRVASGPFDTPETRQNG
jgi:PleD family two-component response regulator